MAAANSGVSGRIPPSPMIGSAMIAAVDRLVEADEFSPRLFFAVPVAARKLQTGFDRFRAAVAEEGARQARQRCQPLRHFALKRMIKKVGRVDERLRLFGERAGQAGM